MWLAFRDAVLRCAYQNNCMGNEHTVEFCSVIAKFYLPVGIVLEVVSTGLAWERYILLDPRYAPNEVGIAELEYRGTDMLLG